MAQRISPGKWVGVGPGSTLRRVLPALCLFVGLSSASAGGAQPTSNIVMDGRLEGVAAEALVGPDYEIPASKGVQAGANLFFSYSRFGLAAGESATFTGPAEIARIVNRVTGGEASTIDGLLRSEIAGASVYLLNPNGIVLGENASLDLSGAFHPTTADYLEFADGAAYHARFPERDTTLSIEPIEAFGFLSSDPAALRVEGSQLIVGSVDLRARGQALSLVAGDVVIRGRGDPDRPAYIFTGGERLDLVALDSPGRVRILNVDPTDPTSRAALEVEALPGEALRFGDVRIVDSSTLVTGGPPPGSSFVSTFTPGSGDVRIRARDLMLEDAVIRTITTSAKDAGRVDIRLSGDFSADGRGLNRTTGIAGGSGLAIQLQDPSVMVERSDFVSDATLPGGGALVFRSFDAGDQLIRVEHRARGDGGPIEIRAENIELSGGAKLSSSGLFGGDGGTIDAVASDTIRLAGTRQDGEPGGFFANAQAGADTRSISVVARRLELDDFAGIFGEVSGGGSSGGTGGSIDVDVDQLSIRGSSRIDTTTRGTGSGGRIAIDAAEWIALSGREDDFLFSSVTTFSLADEATGGAGAPPAEPGGPAGRIEIRTPQIRLTDGAGISTSAEGEGDGGVIDLRADVIELETSSITSVSEFGEAGDIYLNGGPLAPDSTAIEKPEGVRAGRRLFLDRSTISTNANDGAGRGGDIVIDPEFVVLRESAITARAVRGQGGNIVIVADQLIRDFDSVINADSQFSTNGQIEITTSGQDLRDDLATLPQAIPDAVELLRERCAARRSGKRIASLVVRGPDRLPASPSDALSGTYSVERPDRRVAAGEPGDVAILQVADPNSPVELILGCPATKS